MSEENLGVNPPIQPAGTNPPNPQPTNVPSGGQAIFPPSAGIVPGQEKQDPVDPEIEKVRNSPEFKEFHSRTGGKMETAFQRYMDSSTEGIRLRKQYDEVAPFKDKYTEVEKDFEAIRERDPELFERLTQTVVDIRAGKPITAPKPNEPAPGLNEAQAARIAELQYELADFHKEYAEAIGDASNMERIKVYAAGLSGKTDRSGKPFTLRAALLAATQYYHPEVLTDAVTTEALASAERRNSAAEPANAPSGSSQGTKPVKPLSVNEQRVATGMGMTADEYRKWQQT